LFDEVFPHWVELKEVKRHHSENRLKKPSDEVRAGECDDDTAEAYLSSPNREPCRIELPVELYTQ
jgi:hypothetical protein